MTRMATWRLNTSTRRIPWVFVHEHRRCSGRRIRASAKDVLTRAGATDWDDLVKLVARDLGFSKAGKRIRQRLEIVLNGELQTGSFVGLAIVSPSCSLRIVGFRNWFSRQSHSKAAVASARFRASVTSDPTVRRKRKTDTSRIPM